MATFLLKNYTKGELIIKEGQKGDRAFIIAKGMVKIFKSAVDGHQQELAVIGPGQIFGEMCLIDAKPRSASAIALTDVQLRVIYRDHFLELMTQTPQEIKLILILLLNRLRKTSEMVSVLNIEKQKMDVDKEFFEKNIQHLLFPS